MSYELNLGKVVGGGSESDNLIAGDNISIEPTENGTKISATYSNFVKSGSGAKAGLVPSPGTTAGTTKYLREDGTWTVPPDTNTTYSAMTGASASAAGKAGLVPAPATGKQSAFLRGDGTWAEVETGGGSSGDEYASKSIYGDDKVNLGRVVGSSSGTNSVALGYNVVASGNYSHAEGNYTYAIGAGSHAEGYYTYASYANCHAEGNYTTASGSYSHSEGHRTASRSTASHAEGYLTIANGIYSHAEGNSTCAHALNSHAEGGASKAIGQNSHAEGSVTTSKGNNSHSEGQTTLASGHNSHAEGISSTAGDNSHAEGYFTYAIGMYSHSEGCQTTANRESHAEGFKTSASGQTSHAEGVGTTASAQSSHAEGSGTLASGQTSHAEGQNTLASGYASHAEGWDNVSSGDCSHAGGQITTASANCSQSSGYNTIASNTCSTAIGHYNTIMTTGGVVNNTNGHAFVIGNGTRESVLKNAFSVMFNGTVKCAGTLTQSTTADYAEYFEWEDGNPNFEDRVGLFVTIKEEKISIASPEDEYILGIVSGQPAVLANGDCDVWNGMVLRDEFNREIYERAPLIDDDGNDVIDENGNPVYMGARPKINPNYNPDEPYVPRSDRPEWAPIGMLGVLTVYDDGTCKVGGYCSVSKGGIATSTDNGEYAIVNNRIVKNYLVLSRISDNLIKVIFR